MFEWHPFTISSAPEGDTYNFACIKEDLVYHQHRDEQIDANLMSRQKDSPIAVKTIEN